MSYENIIALTNMGSTCYLNSALQMFLNSDLLTNSFDLVDKNQMFLKLVEELISKKKDPNTPLSNPVLLKQELGQFSSFFNEIGQQDCHECLVNFLDVIHEQTKYSKILKDIPGTVLKSQSPQNKNSDKKLIEDLKKSGSSHIYSQCIGQLKSSLLCKICKQERTNFENINHLSLDLPESKNVDIIDCFMDYFHSEELEDKIDCDTCKTKTLTDKNMSLWRFPNVLILHLKRYTQHSTGQYTRNNCIVDFSEELVFQDKDENTNGAAQRRCISYKLKSIVNHYGYTPMGGHYSTFLKYKNPKKFNWIHVDDSNVYDHSDNNIVTNAAYILLYEMV